jgi:gamma-glutamyltranspeptidase/glutathione hydrolase
MRSFLMAAVLTLSAVTAASAQQSRWWSPVVADSAMVVSAKAEATEVGLEILRRGGNAADAAIAVHFALAVTLPYAGNLGGGGFLVWRGTDGRVRSYDYREAAPLAATADMYLDESGEPLAGRPSWFGPLAVATPGSVAGMWLVHERHGTLPWADLVEPAVRLADEGFLVDPYFHDVIAAKAGDIRRFPGAAAILLPGGQVPAIGDTLRQPALAHSLRLIAEHGPEPFYRGEIADSIVSAMEQRGGLVTHEDLARYEAKERDPVTFEYRGHKIHSMGPASSGGITMKLILDQIETFDLDEHPWHGARSVHRIVESMKRAYAVRNAVLGDADFVDIPDTIMTEAFARGLAATIDTLRATPSEEIEPLPGVPVPVAAAEAEQTTHFSIVDPEGNAVSSTTTINGWFGSLETAAGIFLNDEMDDFTIKPGVPNEYGLVQGEANAIEPLKRPLSAMTPTIVEKDGRVRYVVGTPGGSTIITTVTQILIDAIDYGMTFAEALDARRIHHQHLPDVIVIEPFGLSEDTVRVLETMGHDLRTRADYSGRAEGIEVGAETGLLYGRSDLRGGGLADGF